MVLVVVEHLSPPYLENIRGQLVAGGLRRLLERGAYFPDCRHLASTFPSTTLATLATGAWPSQHGIIADQWYDRAAKSAVPASDEMLTATTLAAQVAAEQRSRVHVIGLSESHASLFAGTPDARVYWMDSEGQFTTRGEVPDWLANFNGLRPMDALRNSKWTAMGAPADAPALRTLTWSADNNAEFMRLYKSSPYAQSAQFDLAAELIGREKSVPGDTFDLVCILAGSSELLGYETGSRSVLIPQMLLHLDRRLDIFFTQIGRVLGDTGYDLVLVGAHGAPPEPDSDTRPRMAVPGESVARAVARVLEPEAMGKVEKYIYPFLYLNTDGFREPEEVRLAAGRAAMHHPALANFYTAGGACSTYDDWLQRFHNSFHPKRSGDVMLSYRPEYIEDYGLNRGISYGSLYNYDTRVPVCFYGPQFRAAVNERPVESVDLAPTLARALGVPVPSSSSGRVLSEAFVE